MTKGGDCFMVAANMVVDDGNLILCHGEATGQGKIRGVRHWHAWVESQDVVFDYSNGSKIIMRKEKYYEIGKIDPGKVKRYTAEEAAKLMLKTRNYGRW